VTVGEWSSGLGRSFPSTSSGELEVRHSIPFLGHCATVKLSVSASGGSETQVSTVEVFD
jgi:hypothetical protein